MASHLQSWRATGKTLLNQLTQRVTQLVERLTPVIVATDYPTWRNRFLFSRLRLGLVLAIICLLTFILFDCGEYLLSPTLVFAKDAPPLSTVMAIHGAMLVGLLGCVALSHTQLTRQHPWILFLSLSWSVTLIGQIMTSLYGFAVPDIIAWSLVFLVQATLIPVCWYLHCLSQVSVIGYYLGVNTILGFMFDGKPVYTDVRLLLYLFWLCFICNLVVYLYERLQRAEFESRRELRFFLHAVSHDLRNPVIATLAILRNLLSQAGDTVLIGRSLLERMLQGSDRQLTLISSLLEAHNRDVRGVVCRPEVVDIAELVESVIADFTPLLHQKQVTVTHDISADLPAVLVDPIQIWRVFSNLLSNALEHNPPGVQIAIHAHVAHETRMLTCVVQDSGIGLDLKPGDRLLSPDHHFSMPQFQRVKLGLPLCRQIIEAHGGQVRLMSHPHEGTTCSFTLPLAMSQSADVVACGSVRRSQATLPCWVRQTLNYGISMVRRGLRTLLRDALAPSESANYETWSRTFLSTRLALALWVALIYWITQVLALLVSMIGQSADFANIAPAVQTLIILATCSAVISLCVCLIWQRTPLGQRHPEWVLLGFSWSVALVPQIVGTFLGFPFPDILSWSVIFLTQATLMPVRWRYHVVSQLGVIFYFVGVNTVLGSTMLQGRTIYDASLFLYLFWFCFVCDLSVYLYERLQRNEFESRQQLQIFLHTVTHDLRTPVMGAAMVMQNLLKQPQEQVSISHAMVERMLQGSDRQLSLLNSLIEAHTEEVKECTPRCQPLQLKPLVQSVLADVEPLLIKNQITLTNLISPNLPLVKADATQIWRVISNLVGNALKHNPPGLNLTLSAVVEANMIRFMVRDNGLGINLHHCQQLFELYSRGSRARYTPGLGVGLYICRQIITAHGGEIGVISSPGNGSTFWFTLPISQGSTWSFRKARLFRSK